eukprot:s432_g10.t2
MGFAPSKECDSVRCRAQAAMTNPSGLAPQAICVNTVAPLFPRGKDHQQTAGEWHDVRGGGRLVRDVYPRHIRETETHQHMHRTAAVKHHLRKMADRHEMLSTYEHDFGFMTRPKPRDFSEVPARTQRNLSEPPSRASSARSQAGWTGEYGIDSTTHPQFAKTESKLQGFQQSSAPLRLSVAGWGDCRWSPKTHPNMIMGMTQKRITLQQTTNIMNLRAPDLPFVSR